MNERKRWRDVPGVILDVFTECWLNPIDRWGKRKGFDDYIMEGCLPLAMVLLIAALGLIFLIGAISAVLS